MSEHISGPAEGDGIINSTPPVTRPNAVPVTRSLANNADGRDKSPGSPDHLSAAITAKGTPNALLFTLKYIIEVEGNRQRLEKKNLVASCFRKQLRRERHY